MARLLRSLMALGLAAAVLGGAGFIAFASIVRDLNPAAAPRADAIVVLTGDDDRITAGVRLIVAGQAKRLLISGVHAATRVPAELKRIIRAGDGGGDRVLKCCVDLGRDALNTSGNAHEARHWALGHGFRSLIVVTSSYHMPRSLVEFQRAMPDVTVVPHPVVSSRHLQLEQWWRHAPTARLLFGEYVKFLGATARYGLYRVVQPRPAPPGPGPLPAGAVTVTVGQ